MAFIFEPPPPSKPPRQRTTFELARQRMVANLRAEFARFCSQGRDTRHVKRLSASEIVFILSYGTTEATLAKVTRERGQSLEGEAERLFAAILKGAADKELRRAYKLGTARLAAARAAGTSVRDLS